jgi:hypothetical protein
MTAQRFTRNLPEQFMTDNFAYTLDVFDPHFSEIATYKGKSLAGVKTMGLGAFVYIGLEYFYDEQASTQLLINTLRWKQAKKSNVELLEAVESSIFPPVSMMRSSHLLYSPSILPKGSAEPASYDFDFLPKDNDRPSMRVYPNPFINYTIADIELRKTTNVTIRVFNNLGQTIVTPVRNEVLDPGKYKYKLTNLPEGIYFIEYNCDGEITIKEAIKIIRP